MGLRFRKSISLGKGARINLSKSGIGMSVGVKGARVGFNSKGTYTSVGIPGTGIYSTQYASSKRPQVASSSSSTEESIKKGGGCLLIVIWLIVVVINPAIGITMLVAAGIGYWAWSRTPKRQAAKRVAQAKKLFNDQKYDEAIVLLLEAHKFDPTNDQAVYLLGACSHNSGKFNDAIVYFQMYLELDPENAEIKLLLAHSHYNAENYNEAIHILQKFPDEGEPNIKVIQLLGACFHAQKRYDLAIDVFKKAPLLKRKLDEDLLELHYNLATVYADSGDNKNALKHYKKVYAHDVGYRDVAEKVEGLDA